MLECLEVLCIWLHFNKNYLNKFTKKEDVIKTHFKILPTLRNTVLVDRKMWVLLKIGNILAFP